MGIIRRALWCAVLFCFGVIGAGKEIYAQAIPPTVEPGQIEKRFEAPLTPSLTPETILKPKEEKPVPSVEEAVLFTLKGVRLTGVSVYQEEELLPFYKDYIGKEISLATLSEIAKAITAKYRGDGYILSRAYVPPQKIEEGIVEIRVVEGSINRIKLEGEIISSKLLNVLAKKIQDTKPLRAAVLERYLLLMDDLPGVTARGVLRPSGIAGEVDLVITFSHEATSGSFEANNRGTRFLGPYQGTVALELNNAPLDQYQRTVLRNVTTSDTKELKFFDITHTHTLNAEGTTLTIAGSKTLAEPGSNLKILELESESSSLKLMAEHPLVRSRNENITLQLQLEANQSQANSLGFRLSKDKIRVGRLGIKYDRLDAWEGINTALVEIHQGLDIAGASEKGLGRSRANGESVFTKASVELNRYQPIVANWGIMMGVTGQYASVPLLASEEFGLGGENYGRAYDPSEISGDQGAAAKVELQYGGGLGGPYIDSYQWFAYYDVGAVWNKQRDLSERARQTLASLGTGIRFNSGKDISVSFEIGLPLTRDVASEGQNGEARDPRLFFSVVKRF